MNKINYNSYTDRTISGSFDLSKIFDCGQCFRFNSRGDCFEGVAFGRFVRFSQPDAHTLRIFGATPEETERLWLPYFSFDRDYRVINDDIAAHFGGDTTIRKAMEYGSGIRILRQEPWETVCSFIISQNNNIPRIKKLIEALSASFGSPIETDRGTYFSFPSAQALYDAGEERIFALKTGFRAKYIFDAAQRVVSGELELSKIGSMTTSEAADYLMTVKGIGLKVASCALLFGFDKTDAFPVDVWVRRLMEKYYPDGLDIPALGSYAGIAQQYLFYYERYNAKTAV